MLKPPDPETNSSIAAAMDMVEPVTFLMLEALKARLYEVALRLTSVQESLFTLIDDWQRQNDPGHELARSYRKGQL